MYVFVYSAYIFLIIIHIHTFVCKQYIFLCYNKASMNQQSAIEMAYSQVPNKRVYSFIPNKKVGLLFVQIS